MSSRYCKTIFVGSYLAQCTGALADAVALAAYELEFLKVFWNGRGVYHKGLLYIDGNQVRAVIVMDHYPFAFQLFRQSRGGTVVT